MKKINMLMIVMAMGRRKKSKKNSFVKEALAASTTIQFFKKGSRMAFNNWS